MSNVSLLLAVDSDQPSSDAAAPAEPLRTGYNMVPPFWLACFRPGDIVRVQVPVQDASGRQGTLPLDMLWTTRARALDNVRAFRQALRSCPAVMEQSEPWLQALESDIERASARFIQLYDAEIQMLVGPEDNRPWVDGCLAFVHDIAAARWTGDGLLHTPQAAELFDQAQIQVPAWTCDLEWEEALIGVAG